MGIGEQIQIEREALGMTREDLASRAGISLSSVYRIEQEASIPHRATLSVMRDALAQAKAEASGEREAEQA